jgi:hypothetical protein
MDFAERQKKFGTHGESLLCDRYRELASQLSYYRTLQADPATPVGHAERRISRITWLMRNCTDTLGYVPAL